MVRRSSDHLGSGDQCDRRPADRSRFGDVVIGKPTILVDGVVAGTWSWTGDDVEMSLRRVPREVEEERLRLRDWLAAD